MPSLSRSRSAFFVAHISFAALLLGSAMALVSSGCGVCDCRGVLCKTLDISDRFADSGSDVSLNGNSLPLVLATRPAVPEGECAAVLASEGGGDDRFGHEEFSQTILLTCTIGGRSLQMDLSL